MSKQKLGLPPIKPETNFPDTANGPVDEVFDLDAEIARCRETQDSPEFASDLGTAIVQIKIGKPKKSHYFRVMAPPPKGYLQVLMIEGKELSGVPKEWFLITESLVKALGEYAKGIKKYALVPTIDRDGNVRIWPHSTISVGQAEAWYASRCMVFAEAGSKWVRYEANNSESRYEIIPARDQDVEPKWPIDLAYDEMIKKAVGGFYVTNLEHPVVKALRGDSLVKVETGA